MGKYDKGFELIQELVKKRWIPEIVHSVSLGNHTYTDILNSIEYISHTELIRKLKFLEEYDCVEKTECGINVYYYLKPLGFDLDHIFSHLVELADKYFSLG
ncbi:MAG: winged helix-turn-helix transcriptional regulator [Anaerococcus sp.]